MKPCDCSIDPRHVLHEVDPRLFGSFVENLGRCVYTGIFEADHPTADADGFRQDVAALVRELAPTPIRRPTNTAEHPDRVKPCAASQPGTLPPLSWNILRFSA